MNIPLMDKRVRSLEEMMADLIATSENTSRIVAQTSVAMKEFGDRVDRSIEEGRADRKKSAEEMGKFQEAMQEDRKSFKEEMREFKDKVDRTIEEGRADRRKSAEEMSKFQAEMEANRRKSDEQMSKFQAEMSAARGHSEREMSKFQDEMQEDRRNSKEEMSKFQAEMEANRRKSDERMSKFQAEMSAARGHSEREMSKFQDEMQEDRRNSKEEMSKFQEDMRLDRRELNKKLGEIAHKQGRMAEDLVSPSICRILLEILGLPLSYECNQSERVRRRHSKIRGRRREFDVVAEYGDYVLVVETKSTPKPENIPELLAMTREFRDYFPEFKDRKLIAGLAMLYADKSLIRYASSKGILILAVGDELMDVMNEPGFVPTEF
jgi:chromosome segregation ATPase